MRCLATLLAASLVSLTPGVSVAQVSGEGQFNAVAYGPLPPSGSFKVRPLDNSDHNLVLQREFERLLQTKGYRIADDAVLIFTFETRDELGAWTDRGRRTVLELDAHGGREGGENAQVRVNIFDSSRGGLINEGSGGTAITTPSRSYMEITIDEARTGRRIWQAWTVADLKFTDSETLTRAVVPVVLADLGQSVNRKSFKVP